MRIWHTDTQGYGYSAPLCNVRFRLDTLNVMDKQARTGMILGDRGPAAKPLVWRVFLTCWLVYTFFWTPYIVREHFPAIALAERGSLNVDRYFGWIEDIFRGPKGGPYINNTPGASIPGAVPLVLLRPLLVSVDRWNQSLPRPSVPAGES